MVGLNQPESGQPVFIDTHCHLDAAAFAADREAIITRSITGGVSAWVVPAVGPSNFLAVRDLAAEHHGVAYALGIHPLWLDAVDESALGALDAALAATCDDPKLVAVGEIGLDFFVSGHDQPRQEFFYREQLKLAARYNLPVILHVRKSQDRLLKYLRSIPVSGGIAHAFNGSRQQAQQFIELGFALGFGGALTYQRALNIRRLVRDLPDRAHVLETDAPDIAPEWIAGERNEPQQLSAIAEHFAAIRNQTIEQVATQTRANAIRVLPRLELAIR